MTLAQYAQLPFDTADDLKARLRLLDAERSRLLSAIKAYESGADGNGWDLEGLNLDDMTVKEAVAKILEWHEARGEQEVSAGEIEATLKNFRVRVSRGGGLATEAKSLWLVLVRVLTAPQNASVFKIVSTGSNRRTDRVSLVKPPARKKAL